MACPPGRIGRRQESIPTLKNYFIKKSERKEKSMSNSFMRVDDVARELGVSKSYAYKVIKNLNATLKDKGYMTVAGRVSKKYFLERVCYGESENKERKG
jgi:hypothetical protein